MNFENLNPLNVRLNMLSGNMLPTNSDDFSIIWKIYSGVTWLMQFTLLSMMIIAMMYVPVEKIIQDSIVSFLILWEVGFVVVQMYLCKKQVKQYIQQINHIMCTKDEIMKKIVKETIRPFIFPLKVYCIGGTISIVIWACVPFFTIFKRRYFYYEDFRIAVAFSTKPFSMEVFLYGNCFVLIACIYQFLKKAAIDVYMLNLVIVTTTQYRYITMKLTIILRNEKLRDKKNNDQQRYGSNADLRTEREMKILCHHCHTVLGIALVLKKITSFSFTILYLNNIFRFSFIAIMTVSAMSSLTFIDASCTGAYLLVCLTQLYMLCFCSQQLSDTRRNITDDAFHEKWYLLGLSQKRMFLFLIMSTELQCNLTVLDRFNLSLSSLMTILNQAYSFALLYFKMK